VKNLVSVLALVALAGTAAGQVEFRIVTRTAGAANQIAASQANPVTSAQNFVPFAVQARVIGNRSLGNFNFDIILSDLEAQGTLGRLGTTDSVGAYAANPTNAAGIAGGRAGLPNQYYFLAGINPNFNGLINQSAGTFVNSPLNEIGLVTGSPTGDGIVALTDLDFDGAPDSGSGPLDAAVSDGFLGSNGNWVDVFRFRYTVTDFTARDVSVTLRGATAQTFTNLGLAQGQWGPASPADASVASQGLIFSVIPAPASAALLGLGGLVAARRRRA
jgi:hypothetical protein